MAKLLLRYSRRHSSCRLAWSHGFIGKEVGAIEIVVHTSGNFGGFRAEGGASAAQEDHNHNFSMIGVGKGSEPAEAGTVFGAGPGLTQNLGRVEVIAHATG